MQKFKGLALVLVLWVLVLLTIMAGSFAKTIKRETVVIASVRDLAKASALAEAGINYALLMLSHQDLEQRWQSHYSLYQIEFADSIIRVMISSEAGKVDINHAKSDILRGLFKNTPLEENEVDALVFAIEDWRDSDNSPHPQGGAEKNEYQQAGLSYQPANKAFETLPELQLVLGMNADLYRQIEPLITVYSKNDQINPANASRQVLLSFPDADAELVDNYLQQRLENTQNHLPPPTFLGKIAKTQQNPMYSIMAQAKLDNGMTGGIIAIMRQGKGRHNLPFSMLEWKPLGTENTSLFDVSQDALVINN